ncbi:hypothetical protein MNBD_PLANCTO03-1538 [hydrothermal vent metagenome]|uniref:Uncharacterized protein n=1 Tax=hydrothermal vent metagenome TaxID=652676 RepID=A0A3B1DFK2_9ZZZZ
MHGSESRATTRTVPPHPSTHVLATRDQITRRRIARRWIIGVGVAVVLTASVLVLLSIGLVRMAPAWWRTTHPDDPATIRAAEDIENDVVNVIYEVREAPAETWTVVLRAPDANAWLNTRLTPWLLNADAEFVWPEEISDLQVEFDEGLIHLGVRIDDGENSQILSATLRPFFDDKGALWVRAESAYVGRLPIPADWVVGRADAHWPDVLPARLLEEPLTRHLLGALTGKTPLAADPVFDLGDGRRVRLLGLAPEQGKLRITCRTEFEE